MVNGSDWCDAALDPGRSGISVQQDRSSRSKIYEVDLDGVRMLQLIVEMKVGVAIATGQKTTLVRRKRGWSC